MMPKTINSFTVHLQNKSTSIEEMNEYLNTRFGPSRSEDRKHWYLGRNYNRPFSESLIEITFYGEPNRDHTMMALEHPFVIIKEDADEWYEVSNEQFNTLFEETV
jgi:hypothetical protein